jgi:hypothetical protein
MTKHVLATRRSTITSAQSPYNVCNVLRQAREVATQELSLVPGGVFPVLGMEALQKAFTLFYKAIDLHFASRCMVVLLARIELHTYKSGSSDRSHGDLYQVSTAILLQLALASRWSNAKVSN